MASPKLLPPAAAQTEDQMAQFSPLKMDFGDPTFLNSVYALREFSKSSYLLGLAAWQRGLRVQYFGTQTAAGVQHQVMPHETQHPDLFCITDGIRSHFFNRTLGDASTLDGCVVSADKVASKNCFRKAGINTPAAKVWTGDNLSQIQDFVAQSSAKSFVLKPVKGSMSRDTLIGVPRALVAPILADRTGTAILVEERILGPEFRIYVVGNRVVAAFVKTGIFVVGNGVDSITTLIAQKNARRSANYSTLHCQIDLPTSQKYLAQFGVTLGDVPPLNKTVLLSADRNPARGADTMTVTDRLDPRIARAAVGACAAVGLPNAAVDIMADARGPFVLEVNARAGIHKHSFPTEGQGTRNAVAEAIVDWYFPTANGKPAQRHDSYFDSAPLLAAFAKDGTAAQYLVPPLQ